MKSQKESEQDGNRNAVKQLKIPLTRDEVEQLHNGDHVKINLSDSSTHEEMILFRDNDSGENQ
jgi:hypothetical protein